MSRTTQIQQLRHTHIRGLRVQRKRKPCLVLYGLIEEAIGGLDETDQTGKVRLDYEPVALANY
jgi:hypothetical protein